MASGEDRYDTKAVLGRLRRLWEAAGGRVADGKSARVGYRFLLPYLPPNRPPNWDNVLVRFMIDQEGQWRKGVFHEKKKDDLQIRLNTCLDGVVPPDILENWLSRLKNLGFDRTAVEGASFHIDRRRGIPAEVLIETERVLQEILEYLDSRFGRFVAARS